MDEIRKEARRIVKTVAQRFRKEGQYPKRTLRLDESDWPPPVSTSPSAPVRGGSFSVSPAWTVDAAKESSAQGPYSVTPGSMARILEASEISTLVHIYNRTLPADGWTITLQSIHHMTKGDLQAFGLLKMRPGTSVCEGLSPFGMAVLSSLSKRFPRPKGLDDLVDLSDPKDAQRQASERALMGEDPKVPRRSLASNLARNLSYDAAEFLISLYDNPIDPNFEGYVMAVEGISMCDGPTIRNLGLLKMVELVDNRRAEQGRRSSEKPPKVKPEGVLTPQGSADRNKMSTVDKTDSQSWFSDLSPLGYEVVAELFLMDKPVARANKERLARAANVIAAAKRTP